jgi:sarcosine oxidase subunit delta
MGFLLDCPNCGKRPVSEFAFRGEYKQRPSQEEPFEAWTDYVFMAQNRQGPQVEWWQHRSGCQRWLLVRRDTTHNTDHESFWFEERSRHVDS